MVTPQLTRTSRNVFLDLDGRVDAQDHVFGEGADFNNGVA